MSIVIAATTQPSEAAGQAGAWMILLPWLALGLLVMRQAGVFRSRTILGPPRVAPEERSVFFAILLLMTLGVWLFSGAGLFRLPIAEPWRLIVASAVSYALGTGVMLVANAFFRNRGLERFGLTARLLPRGVWQAVVATFALLPVVFVVLVITELVTQALQVPVPEHELLKRLRDELSTGSALLLIGVAVVLAPLFEELLFRGVLQTFLVRVLGGRQPEGPDATVPMTAPVDDSPMARIERAEAVPAPDSQRIVARWLGIAISSLMFAAVHGETLWLAPLFVLSVGLGYAYEKTGNLWVPVVMHALFNGLQITLFLLTHRAGA